MLLPDWLIEQYIEEGQIKIDPYDLLCVQPASYDVHLGRGTIKPTTDSGTTRYFPRRIKELEYFEVPWQLDGSLLLPPKSFMLGQLQEHITLPADLAAKLEGKSTIGRAGITVHVTAGWVDPGWDGVLTLELCNLSENWLILDEDQKIAQISFYMMAAPAKRPYGHRDLNSHYQGDTTVQGAKT